MTPAQSQIKAWRENPRKMVWDLFRVEPDPKQGELLDAFVTQPRIAQKGAAGTAKTTGMAFCTWNFLLCYAMEGKHPIGAALSVSDKNLHDNFWKELSVWHAKSPLLQRAFTLTYDRVFANDHPKTWFMAAKSFPRSASGEQQAEALSGMHGEFVLFIIDESSTIHEAVIGKAEQALSTGPILGRIIQSGNPTSIGGCLHAAFTKWAHRWYGISITGDPNDPNRSPRVSIDWAEEQIRLHGRDNPWVQAYVLAQFPESSLNTLLSPDEVEASMERGLREEQFSFAQKRLGVDVARFGDDKTVIFPRQGLWAGDPLELRGMRSNDIAARIMRAKSQWGSEMEFIDDTGGYGSGVIDSLIQAGQGPLGIHFAGKPMDGRYLNKRAEMWFQMAEWVKRGGSLPDHAELMRELTTPTYTFRNGKFQLEEKDQIKKRLGHSCDFSDALALTFALPEMPASMQHMLGVSHETNKTRYEYDPFANRD